MATAKKASEEKAKPKKAAAKPADKAKKAATAKPKTSTTSKKTSTAKTAKAGAPEQRYRMIEVAAYYIAEKNGFAGNAADYWVQAEIEINAKYPK